MGRGSSKIDRGSTSNSRVSNAKYHGFKIVTNDGRTMNLVVQGGTIAYADGSEQPDKFLLDELKVFQDFYDSEGSEQAIIDRINKIGLGKASVLSDKSVEDLRKKRRKDRIEHDRRFGVRHNKGGINRHRAYWSEM